MDKVPSFLDSFGGIQPEDIYFNKDQEPSHPSTTSPSFTIRDWEMLKAIGLVEPCYVSNGQLGKKLGMTNGAVSARIKRLGKMGLIHIVHYNATDTGKNNLRQITVLKVPPKPWVPE